MDTRKITLIATIAVIALVAVGIGYAYTATTVNSGNNVTDYYVTLTQDDGAETPVAKYTFNASLKSNFDSITTDGNGAKYRIDATTTGYDTGVANYTLIDIGSVTIRATPHGYADNASLPAVNLAVTSTGFDITNSNAKFHYYLVSDGSIVAYTTADNTWKQINGTSDVSIPVPKADSGLAYEPVAIKLCYGYANADKVGGTGPDEDYVFDTPGNLAGGTVTFTATIDNETTA